MPETNKRAEHLRYACDIGEAGTNLNLLAFIQQMRGSNYRSKSEDVKERVPQFDANFEDRLNELKQQGSQQLSVSSLHCGSLSKCISLADAASLE